MVARRQLLTLGLGAGAIDSRIGAGRLHRMHQGVYLVGHAAAAPYARELAAVLACGPGAVLSHWSAAALWEIRASQPDDGEIDVTVPRRAGGSRPGVRIHRVRKLDPRETRVRFRIPVTSPSRTLLDLAATCEIGELEQAVAMAERRRLTGTSELARLLARHKGRAGTRRLRRLLQRNSAPAFTRSEAERLMLRLVRRARLPEPQVNVRVGRYEVDFLWRTQRLVVEIDGFDSHSSRASFEADRRRDAYLMTKGFEVLRITWWQLTEEPEATLAVIAGRLARAE